MSGNYFCEGVEKSSQRSLFNALGFTKEEMKRPLVGIVSSYNEIVPGHERVSHACMTHCDTVTDRDSREHNGSSACHCNAELYSLNDLVNVLSLIHI